jgi:mRNA guanylyltransferase
MDPGAQPLRDIAAPGVKAQGDLLRELRAEVANLLGRAARLVLEEAYGGAA